MLELKPLFSRDSSGAIQIWYIQISNGELGEGIITSYSGLLLGKHTPHTLVIPKGKNIGKANETTPYEQAVLEAKSKWNEKKDKGYKALTDLNINEDFDTNSPETFESWNVKLNVLLPIHNTDANNRIKPMKAQPYLNKKTGKIVIKFPAIGQPKLNGIRCTCLLEGDNILFQSKEGKSYWETTRHIAEQFRKEDFEAINGEAMKFDGELYIHGMKLQQIRSAVVKLNLNSPRLQFRVFDLPIDNVAQNIRLELIKERLKRFVGVYGQPIELVPDVFPVETDAQAQQLTDDWLAQGYEGGIFRLPTATYKFGKRLANMVKLKRVEDGEFEVIDIIDSRDNPGIATFVCRNDINTETFKVNPEGTVEEKQEYFTNKDNYIGKMATVQYRERTDAPKELPFHAVLIAVRDYESNEE